VQSVPKDIDEWMRRMERNVRLLQNRTAPRQDYSPFALNVPRYRSRVAGNVSISASPTEIAFTSQYPAPYTDGHATFVNPVLVGSQYRYNILQAGLYHVRADLQWSNMSNGSTRLNLYRNNDSVPVESDWRVANANNQAFRNRLEAILPLNAGDYFRFNVMLSGVASGLIIAIGPSGQYGDSALAITPVGGYDYV